MDRIVFTDYKGDFIQKDGQCYFYTGQTFETVSATGNAEQYSSCLDCQLQTVSSSSSSDSSSSNALSSVFRTESQGTITPSIITNDSSLADWDWGDGNQTLDDNSPSHTYVAPFDPFYDVDIFNVDPLQIQNINLAGGAVIDLNLTPFPNVINLTVNNNPGLNTLDITGLTGLVFLTTFNTNVGASLDFTGLSSVFSFRSWNSGLTNSALATLTSPVLNTLVVRTNTLGGTINLTPFTLLDRLECFGCSLVGALNTSSNTSLTRLWVHFNSSLGALDISTNTLLDDFNIRETGRTNGEIDQYLIDLDGHGQTNGSFNYSNNPGEGSLTALTEYNNLLAKGWTITGLAPSMVMLSTSKKSTIKCPHENLTELDVKNETQLVQLICNDNKIQILEVDELLGLMQLRCQNNNIHILNVTFLEDLMELNCARNNIAILNLENLNELTDLDCSNNNIAVLNIDNCQLLEVLIAENNNLFIDQVDYILRTLVSHGGNDGELNLKNNNKPSSLGYEDSIILKSRGWKIYLD